MGVILEGVSGELREGKVERTQVLTVGLITGIRIPAAFQGLYGLRPSYNRVPCKS